MYISLCLSFVLLLVIKSSSQFELSIDTTKFLIKLKFADKTLEFDKYCKIRFNTRDEHGDVVEHEYEIEDRERGLVEMAWLQTGKYHDLCFYDNCDGNTRPVYHEKFVVPR